MLVVIVIVIAVVVIILAGGAKGKAGRTTTYHSKTTSRTTDHSKTTSTRTTDHTRYEKSGNWMDFDIGRDEKKVGDSRFPKAGIDSVMKHEFLDELFHDN